MSEYKYFRSAVFHSTDSERPEAHEYIEDAILVVRDGRVEQVGHSDAVLSQIAIDASIQHFPDALIVPGFIDTHVHYPQLRVIGSYGKQLLDWLNDYTFPEEQKFNETAYAEEVADHFFDQILSHGTTTAASYCTSHPESVDVFFSAAQKRNLRMLGGKVLMDRHAPAGLLDDAESGYRDSQSLIEKWHGQDRLLYAITPRFAPTSTPEQLKKVGDLLAEFAGGCARDGVRLQTHMNENRDEIRWVSELYPERQDYLDVYQHYGLLGEQTILGHCIHNSEDELKRMADSGTKVALCPTSNLFIGSGLFDLQQLQQQGVDCGFASDVGGGDSFSMLRVMSEAYKVCQLQQYNLNPFSMFYYATLGAAKVLNLDHCLGNFTPNKEADFLVMDLQSTGVLQQRLSVARSIEETLFALMMLGDDRAVSEVYIMGERAYSKQ